MTRYQDDLPLLFHVLKSVSSERTIDLKALNQTRWGDQFHLYGEYINCDIYNNEYHNGKLEVIFYLRHFSVETVPPIFVEENLGIDLLSHLTFVPLLLIEGYTIVRYARYC